jgi:hypothetical protein
VTPGRLSRGDVLAVILAAGCVGALYARFWQPAVAADTVEVRIAGTAIGRYPLQIDRELTVEGRRGPVLLTIQDGRVRFSKSPCRNQICVHSGWLSHSGDAAACLPSRISISLSGHGIEALDAVSF